MVSKKDEDAFNSAKEALLSSYNSQQSNQTTRLLGFIGVLFSIMLLSSQINLGIIVIDNIFRVLFQTFAILLLLTLTIFTLVRFSVFSQLSSDVIYVSYSEVETELKNGLPLHHALWNATWARVKIRKVYGIKLSWFAQEGQPGKDRSKGWLLSLGISAIPTVLIMLFFLF